MKPSELHELVYDYKTKNKEGFIQEEINEIFKLFPDINMDKYYDSMRGNTCMMRDGKFINYHCDVYQAILCGIENRSETLLEWD